MDITPVNSEPPKTVFPYARWIPMANLLVGIASVIVFALVVLLVPRIEGKYILILIFASVWTVYFLAKSFTTRRLGYVTFEGEEVYINIDGFKNQKVNDLRKVQKSGKHRYYLTTPGTVVMVNIRRVDKSSRPRLITFLDQLITDNQQPAKANPST